MTSMSAYPSSTRSATSTGLPAGVWTSALPDEVGHSLAKTEVVTCHAHRYSDLGDDRTAWVSRASVAHRVIDHRGQVDRRTVERTSLVETCEQEQVVDEHAHAPGLVFDSSHGEEHVIACHIGVPLQQLRVPAHGRERGAQLVRCIRDEMAQLLLGDVALRECALDLSEHLVERESEPTDLGLLC